MTAGCAGQTLSTSTPEATPKVKSQKKSQVFDLGNLTFEIPKSSEIVKMSGEGADLLIQSSKGYVITIDSQNIPEGRTLEELEQELDRKFLGPGKRWEQKLAYRTFPIHSSSAFDLLYKGPHTTDRVLLWIKGSQAYTFMFFASHESFERLTIDFDRFVDNIRLMEIIEARKPVQKTSKQTSRPHSEKLSQLLPHTEKDLGFFMSYPNNWDVAKVKQTEIEFGGKKGSREFPVFVDVQSVVSPPTFGEQSSVELVMSDLTKQIHNSWQKVSIVKRGGNNSQLADKYKQITVNFLYKGEAYRQWFAIIPRPSRTTLYVWTYTAPEKLFSEFEGRAALMLSSFVPQ
ncbi:MAG: PsbP-related protein [Rhodospirillales bacterium]|nr:PsbP-related protein [Rhodospirillales bacterium]